MDEVRRFYDDLSSDYHLIYEDWWRSVERQGEVLDGIVRGRLGPGPKRVLDSTAGVGTQSLGLALLGHEVVGTDLSEAAVDRARREAESRGISASFRAWDVRRIDELPGEPFDVVLSADNSLPHLIAFSDLNTAAQGMLAKTRPGGLVVVSTRDYEELVSSRPRVEGPRILGEVGARRIILQLWDWEPEAPIYRLTHLVLTESEGRWQTSSRSCTYRAMKRSELEAAFQAAGGTDLEWLEPEATGFFQPIVCLSRPSSV
jgi:2-polyprenyl-3-methyl-5-hydroxy-6-metoxy-1,4-benzoquinol methylase